MDETTRTSGRHSAEDRPSLSGDLATGYDILRAHYLAEADRQRAAVRDAAFALDSLTRRQLVDPEAVPRWQITRAVRASQDAEAVQSHVLRMLSYYPERNRDMAVAS